MIIGLVSIALLLSNTVLGNDCRKTFTISPGNITRYTQPLTTPLTSVPSGSTLPVYCDYFLRAPSSNYYIEVNFTEHHYQQNDGQAIAGSSPLQPDSKSMPSSSSSSSQQQTSQSVLPPSGGRQNNNNKALPIDSHTSSCLPNIAVVELTLDGKEQVQQELCLKKDKRDISTVFRSKSHILKLHYSWDPRQSVSFTLTFVFHKWPSACSSGQFSCDDGTCLPDTSLVCDTVADCLDQSDEHKCVIHSSPVNKQFTEVIVIVIVVVFTLGVIACVFVHYRLTTRMWRDHHPDSSSTEHQHLHPHTPQSTEVVYVPGMPMDHIEQEVALQRERQIRLHGIHTDIGLNLPPAIHISADGEEGYLRSQKRIRQLSCDENGRRESIRPPPNKTAYQGDSPPPYRSNSVSRLEGHYCGGRRAGSSAHQTPSSIVVSKMSGGSSNSPSIARCHSMSSDKRLQSYTNHHGCHTVLPPSGGHQGYHSSQSTCSHHNPRSSHSYSSSPPLLPPGDTMRACGGSPVVQTLSSAPSAGVLKTRTSSHALSPSRTDSPANALTSHCNGSSGCHSCAPSSGIRCTDHSHVGPPPEYSSVASTAAIDSQPAKNTQAQFDSKV